MAGFGYGQIDAERPRWRTFDRFQPVLPFLMLILEGYRGLWSRYSSHRYPAWPANPVDFPLRPEMAADHRTPRCGLCTAACPPLSHTCVPGRAVRQLPTKSQIPLRCTAGPKAVVRAKPTPSVRTGSPSSPALPSQEAGRVRGRCVPWPTGRT